MADDFDRAASEEKICRTLGEIGRACKTREQIKKFVSEFGIPWWIENPDQELLDLVPLRFRGKFSWEK